MFDLTAAFAKVEAFVVAAEHQAVDASVQGEAALRAIADWIAATRTKLTNCTPEQESKAKELLAKCHKCCPECDPKHPKSAIGLPGNPILTLLFNFLQQWLATLIVTPTETPKA